MDTHPDLNGQENNLGLNSTEIDTIGEILNISMGAAATAVSILLNRQVIITTPSVRVVHSSEFDISRLEPALGIEIKYVQGLFGSNHMIMSVRDIKAIVQLLLGSDFEEPADGESLDEIAISALGEVMNQMMGASCTALASFLDREINISPPAPFDITGETDGQPWTGKQEYIVTVSFKLTIEGLVDSEFFTVMPVPFARELVSSAMGMSEEDTPLMELEPEASQAQVVGHTQVPAPMHGNDYPVQPQAVAAPVPVAPPPPPAAAPVAAPAPVAVPVPAPAPRPAPAPAPVAMPAPVAAPVARPAPAPAPRPAPAGGYAAEKAAPPKNVVVKPLQFGSLDADDPAVEDTDTVNLGLVMGVDLNVTVEIGRTKKQVKEILSLRQGSIVELDKQAGAPVDIVVNGKLIARGDVVVIDDNFGVRITEIVSAAAQR